MTTVVIVIHLMVVVAMVGLILLQRSEGGALGIGGSGSLMTGRGAGNMLSHTTAYLALAFFLTSLGLALIGKYQGHPSDILQQLPGQTTTTNETPAAPDNSGSPTSAQDLLNQLGGSTGDTTSGPQTPPPQDTTTAPSSDTTTPADTTTPTGTNTPPSSDTTTSAPDSATTTPAPSAPSETPPATQDNAPAAETPSTLPTPPLSDTGGQ